MDDILLLIEHDNDNIKPISYELVAAARELQNDTSATIRALVPGADAEGVAHRFARDTGIDTIVLENPYLETHHAEVATAVLNEFLSEASFRFLMAGHTSQMLDILPALAVERKADCVTAVERISINAEGQPTFQRSICGGKLVTEIISGSDQTLLTIQPGGFQFKKQDKGNKPSGLRHAVSFEAVAIHHLETLPAQSDDSALREARVIVAAGRGIEDEANLEWIRKLSRLFTRSAVAGSRPLCDLGWLEYNQQVGITGATVSPDLYLACGISGTSQHIYGMKGSGFVVAINKDPRSAMFNHADICIVEDLTTFLPLLLEVYEAPESAQPLSDPNGMPTTCNQGEND